MTPPIVNRKMNPKANKDAVLIRIAPPHNVANQLKTFTPVGTAMIIVAAVKYARVSASNPTVYM